MSADVCLVAIGRGPVTEGLGLDGRRRRRRTRRGSSRSTRSFGRTSTHVWAIGDVASTPLQLAHVAFTEGYAVAERIAGLDVAEIDYVNIPKVTYCSPEIASVGLTEAQAREPGLEVVVGEARLPRDRQGEHRSARAAS